MKPGMLAYIVAVHVLLAISIATSIWFGWELKQRNDQDAALLQKYQPAMQRLSDDLGINIEIKEPADLLEAFDRIVFRVN